MHSVFAAIMLASTSTAPLVVHTDWIAGCDNSMNCKAVSLQPEPDAGAVPVADGALLVSVARTHMPDAPLVVAIKARDGESTIMALSLDGIPVDITGQAGHFVVEFSGASARAIVEQLAGGKSLSAADSKGGHIGSASMAGIAAALRHIEQVQRQENPGVAPLVVPPKPKGKPARLAASDLARRGGNDPCLSDTVMLQHAVPRYMPPPEYVRLDGSATMLIMHDRCRGDNAESRLLLLDNRGRAQRLPFEPEIADLDHDFDHDAETSVPNVWWDEGSRTLRTSYIRRTRILSSGRRAVDCGGQSAYAWADGRFVMVYHAQMPVCRGTPDFIATYHREVVQQGRP